MIVIFYTRDQEKLLRDASFYAWMFFVIAVASLLGNALQQVFLGRMGQELGRRVRTLLFASILRQEVGWFDHEANSSGRLASMLAADASHVRGAVGDALGIMAQNFFCLAFGYLVAFIYEWRMALVVTGLLPFLLSANIIYYKFTTGFSSNADKLYAGANQAVTDAFSSIRVVQAYGLGPRVGGLYARMLVTANATMVRHSHVTGLAMGYSNFCIFGMYAIIIIFGAVEVRDGRRRTRRAAASPGPACRR